MAELSDLFAGLLDGAVAAVNESEGKYLAQQVSAVKQLGGKDVDAETLLKLFAAGWLPDFFVTAQMELAAQLTMSTARERQVSGTGGVTFGPVKLEGSLSNTFHQGTSTNLSVSCTLVRQSRNAALDAAYAALGATKQPAAPNPPTGPTN
ncbi:MAG TPA: hypothetical protein VFU47_02385 [Armatimonadota bacterium]|nr:hypothetical protein [Armatimonadota bacterium]